uniref:Uncharacterized protein n=1 Tax=Anguilla anguilla TaxID=7936 RepID=A0A0E9PIA6_ANGAN
MTKQKTTMGSIVVSCCYYYYYYYYQVASEKHISIEHEIRVICAHFGLLHKEETLRS